MALARTHLTRFQTAAGGAITMSCAEAANRTPTAGSLQELRIVINAVNSNGTAVTSDITLYVTDNWGDTGGTAWTRQADCHRGVVGNAQYFEAAETWTRVIGTGAAAGKVTVTAKGDLNSGGDQLLTTSTDGWLWVDPVEWTGQHASAPVGATTGSTGRQAAGPTTFTEALNTAPASTSAVAGFVHQDNSTVTPTLPSGWTLDQDDTPAWGAESISGFQMGGSPSQNPQWTVIAATSNTVGCALEIKAAAAASASVPPVSRPRRISGWRPTVRRQLFRQANQTAPTWIPPRNTIRQRQVRAGLRRARGSVLFVEPNQTPPTWLPPRPYTIRQRPLRPGFLRRRPQPQVIPTTVTVTVTSPPQIQPRRRFTLTRPRRTQPQATPAVTVTVQPIAAPRRTKITARRGRLVTAPFPPTPGDAIPGPHTITRRRLQLPGGRDRTPVVTPIVAVVYTPPVTARRRFQLPAGRDRTSVATPSVTVVSVAVPAPQTITRRRFLLHQRRRFQPVTPSVTVVSTAVPTPQVPGRRRLFTTTRRRVPVVTPLTQVAVTVTQPPPQIQRRRINGFGSRRRTQPTVTPTVTVFVPTIAHRRTTVTPARRGHQATVPVNASVFTPAIRTVRRLLARIWRRPRFQGPTPVPSVAPLPDGSPEQVSINIRSAHSIDIGPDHPTINIRASHSIDITARHTIAIRASHTIDRS